MKPSASSLSLPRVAASRIPVGRLGRPESTAWFVRWQAGHSRLAGALFATAALAFALGLELPSELELALLAGGVALFGLPHGALDHLTGRSLLQRLGRWWAPAFALAYLVPAAIAIAAWLLAPQAMLVTFLLYSAWHFGTEDSLESSALGFVNKTAAIFRGIAPIALPSFLHAEEVTRVFNLLLPPASALEPAAVKLTAGVALSAAIATLAAGVWSMGRRRDSDLSGFEWVEIGGLIALFAYAPPLVAFLLYFCGLHSPRQLMRIGRSLAPDRAPDATRRVVREALPLTAAAVALGLAAWTWLAAGGIQTDAALTRVIFMGLSALTVPHMLFDSIAARRS